ncbi:MAG: hypothetical protein H7233_10260 [Pseudorhodobacter sp.]|nr:hypothetical protein [Frankiaceae bacterium]
MLSFASAPAEASLAVLTAISGIALLDQALVGAAAARLDADRRSGAWRECYAVLLGLDEQDCGYRPVVRGS